MRLHRLEVCGFGPFLDRQVVDFDAFADDGIFLIAGRTGAGKSSILDAVCFGLYGGVPRYDTGEKRLRSDHCDGDDPTEVVVEFSTVAGRFRVTRSPAYERPAKRGGGTTTQAAAVSLDEWTDAGWAGIAAKERTVGLELDRILQLSREQFLQVILLAQNRFADFLLADSKDRQALLRRLFGTGRFSDYQARFDERRRAAEQALRGRVAGVEARLDEAERVAAEAELWGDDADVRPEAARDRIERLRRAIARAGYRVEQLETERAAAEKALNAADAALADRKEQRQAQMERDRARAALAALDAESAEIAAARTRRDRARAAEVLRSLIMAVERAERALTDAAEHRATAVGAARETGVPLPAGVLPAGSEPADSRADHDAGGPYGPEPDPHAPEIPGGADRRQGAGPEGSQDLLAAEEPGPSALAGALRDWASERTRESGAWQRAAELEAQEPERRQDLTAAQEAVETASAELAGVEAERADAPAQLAELVQQRDEARRTADRTEELARTVDEAKLRRSGATEVERLTGELADAQRIEADASLAHAEAQRSLADLRQRRLDGYAGELAASLTPGEPCAVCGAREHPQPAEHADPVSADDIAAAETARDAAATAERAATQRVSTLAAVLAVATERAAGRSVEQAEGELSAATRAHQDAVAAGERAAVLDERVLRAERRRDELEALRTAASERLAAARIELTVCGQRSAEAERVIAEARGEHDSVTARLEEATRRIESALAAADALDEHAGRAAALTAAVAERDVAIGGSPFPGAPEATAALLSPAEVAALDERIERHAVQREKERAILLDLELRTLPEELIDLASAQDAAALARQAWLSAVGEHNRAGGVRDVLTATVDAASAEHEASAAEAEEFEIIRGLADTLAGRSGNTHRMDLETFVLAAELEEIVSAANLRLNDMSDGRYQLRHSDARAARGAASGLGIVVFDAFTGQTRPAKSLSGGETFLSSLALALGLAEVVTSRAGGIRLDTLFIDEGFGSLDADTLETAMRALDELRQGGRTVGVISHVEAMQEQIPAQLTVRALPDGPSVIDAPRAR